MRQNNPDFSMEEYERTIVHQFSAQILKSMSSHKKLSPEFKSPSKKKEIKDQRKLKRPVDENIRMKRLATNKNINILNDICVSECLSKNLWVTIRRKAGRQEVPKILKEQTNKLLRNKSILQKFLPKESTSIIKKLTSAKKKLTVSRPNSTSKNLMQSMTYYPD